MKLNFIFAVFVFMMSYNGFSQTNPVGMWHTDKSQTPFFSFTGELPFEAKLPNGENAVLDPDPYFLMGNYKFKLFTYTSGQYEVFSGERVASRFNKKENTKASIQVDGKM